MSVDWKLENVTSDGTWIEGDIHVKVDIGLINIDKSQHFKTLKDTQQAIKLGSIPLVGDVTVTVIGTLESPNRACVSGKLDPGAVDLGKKCVTIPG